MTPETLLTEVQHQADKARAQQQLLWGAVLTDKLPEVVDLFYADALERFNEYRTRGGTMGQGAPSP